MRTILLPIDGSNFSLSALEYMVGRRARGERLKVAALYIQPAPLIMNEEVKRILPADQLKVLANRRTAAAMNRRERTPRREFLIEKRY